MKKIVASSTLFIALVLLNFNSFSQKPAKLIVYRNGTPYGSLARYQLKVDGKEVSSITNKAFYTMDLTPGAHVISAKQENRSVSITAQRGETYVVKFHTPIHILGAKAKLKTMTIEEAKADSKYFSKKTS